MNPSTRPPHILFYVQHLLGIGHLARASRIASALVARGAEVTLVTGGLPVTGFPPTGLRHVTLPPVQSAGEGFSGLADAEGRPVDAAFLEARRDRLLELFRQSRPDVVVTEAFPFGRRQMRFELDPLLEVIEATRPRPVLCCSLRDILQARTKPGRDAETVARILHHYDRVLVHGDPAFARLEDSFSRAAEIASRVVYTGLVAPARPEPSADRFDIVVSAGGGAVGAELALAAMAAAAILPSQLRHCIICGPNLQVATRSVLVEQAAAMAAGQVTIETFRSDFAAVLASARLSISQAGYNTVCDVLQAGCRSILVPFAAGGETEQTARACLLQAKGRAVLLPEENLSGERLAAAIARALSAPRPSPDSLDLDGAAKTANILYNLTELRNIG
ncbi:glycosyltransferase [Paracoccus sp. MBLB3053]|uniref:Glycosyltransferase n=1 Tax=Paracoccus aurantius TaxID=3073814 RepID=A0ABU2HYG6_9RHOB|nr:glycosyltransferase [Paracoccus sp. MBLB3053]MDS9470086.1 glycosyltransferase [Paracoccus sp. MBLB3053]